MTSRSRTLISRAKSRTNSEERVPIWVVELQVNAGADALNEDLARLYFAMQALDPAALHENDGQLQMCLLVAAEVPADAGDIAVDAVGALAGARIEQARVVTRTGAAIRWSLSGMT